jgi:hypothetical protein
MVGQAPATIKCLWEEEAREAPVCALGVLGLRVIGIEATAEILQTPDAIETKPIHHESASNLRLAAPLKLFVHAKQLRLPKEEDEEFDASLAKDIMDIHKPVVVHLEQVVSLVNEEHDAPLPRRLDCGHYRLHETITSLSRRSDVVHRMPDRFQQISEKHTLRWMRVALRYHRVNQHTRE